MFFSYSLSKACRAALRFATCLMAVCLYAGFVSEASANEAAPPQGPPNSVFMLDNPCPAGITPKTWAKALTLWRMAYSFCKPQSAPVRYAFKTLDAEQFIRELGFRYPDLGGLGPISFPEFDSRTFRVKTAMGVKNLTTAQAQTVAAEVLKRLVLYLETNGYNPKEEKLRLSAQVVAATDEGKVSVYALFDTDTGNIRYKMLPDE